MSGGNLSPRQKMINMMYLVLMALLALNVSKEILKSFFFFEQSFNAAALNIESKNNATITKGIKKNKKVFLIEYIIIIKNVEISRVRLSKLNANVKLIKIDK